MFFSSQNKERKDEMIHRIAFYVLLVFVTFSPNGLQAQTQPTETTEKTAPPNFYQKFARVFEFTVPINVFAFENNAADPNIEGEGVLSGFRLSTEINHQEIYFRFDFDGQFGEVEPDDLPGSIDGQILDLRMVGGYIFSPGRKGRDRLILYGGLAGKIITFDHSGNPTVSEEEASYVYLPLGARLEVLLNPSIKFSFDLSILAILTGQAAADTSLGDTATSIEPSPGVRMTLTLDWVITPKLLGTFTFGYEYNRLDGRELGSKLDTHLHSILFYVGVKIPL